MPGCAATAGERDGSGPAFAPRINDVVSRVSNSFKTSSAVCDIARRSESDRTNNERVEKKQLTHRSVRLVNCGATLSAVRFPYKTRAMPQFPGKHRFSMALADSTARKLGKSKRGGEIGRVGFINGASIERNQRVHYGASGEADSLLAPMAAGIFGKKSSRCWGESILLPNRKSQDVHDCGRRTNPSIHS
jgi:hypothetical protein